MSTNPVYESDLLKVSVIGDKLQCAFNSKATTDTFMQTNLFSKILSSFVTDSEGVWRPGKRSNFEIIGWPKHLDWKRVDEKTVETFESDIEAVDAYQYAEILERSLANLLVRTEESDGGSYYHFSIGDDENVYEYSFNDRARVIGALAVLYDLDVHPRGDLEINIPTKFVAGLKWPIVGADSEVPKRYYGDPSKTADVLRNEGWTREGDDAHMFVSRNRINGQQQQFYKISTREQSRTQQVKRTAIKNIWKNKLYKMQDYTCRICLNNYKDDVAQLSPDHRIPVIFQADNLTDDNFSEKLMTLCRYCNQQKREFCKRITPEYDWDNSPWAYPEKHRFDRLKAGIKEYASQNELSNSKVVELLAEEFQS